MTVKAIDPKPLYGGGDSRGASWTPWTRSARRTSASATASCSIRRRQMKVAYDSGVRNWFDPALIQKLPVAMKPGDSLVSTISMPKGLVLHAQLRNKIERGVDDSSPIRTAAVLTCVAEPQPPDAFRPAFCDRQAEDLPGPQPQARAAAHGRRHRRACPKIEQYVRFTAAAVGGHLLLRLRGAGGEHAAVRAEYGRVVGHRRPAPVHRPQARAEGAAAGELRPGGHRPGRHGPRGHPGWKGFGGHGSGRKLPIVFAGLLLGDDELANINK